MKTHQKTLRSFVAQVTLNEQSLTELHFRVDRLDDAIKEFRNARRVFIRRIKKLEDQNTCFTKKINYEVLQINRIKSLKKLKKVA